MFACRNRLFGCWALGLPVRHLLLAPGLYPTGYIYHIPDHPLRHAVSSTRLMATAKEVQTTLRQLLPTLDMETTTERQIREQLAEKLGPIEEHRKLIKASCRRSLQGFACVIRGAACFRSSSTCHACAARIPCLAPAVVGGSDGL
jgi:hypothetical protein